MTPQERDQIRRLIGAARAVLYGNPDPDLEFDILEATADATARLIFGEGEERTIEMPAGD